MPLGRYTGHRREHPPVILTAVVIEDGTYYYTTLKPRGMNLPYYQIFPPGDNEIYKTQAERVIQKPV